MGYSLSHSSRDGTLRIDLSGTIATSGLRELLQDVVRITRSENAERILVDVRGLADEIGPVDTLNLIKEYPQDTASLLRRVAVLERPEQAYAHGFHETAAQNRGHRLRHFTDRAQAEAWLFAAKA